MFLFSCGNSLQSSPVAFDCPSTILSSSRPGTFVFLWGATSSPSPRPRDSGLILPSLALGVDVLHRSGQWGEHIPLTSHRLRDDSSRTSQNRKTAIPRSFAGTAEKEKGKHMHCFPGGYLCHKELPDGEVCTGKSGFVGWEIKSW